MSISSLHCHEYVNSLPALNMECTVITFLWWTPVHFPPGYSWVPLSLSFSFYYTYVGSGLIDPTMPLQNLFSLPGHRFRCRVPAHFLLGFLPNPGLYTQPEWAPPWKLHFITTFISQRLSRWHHPLLKHSDLKAYFLDPCIIESSSNKYFRKGDR